jgi:hypothetical protein
MHMNDGLDPHNAPTVFMLGWSMKIRDVDEILRPQQESI